IRHTRVSRGWSSVVCSSDLKLEKAKALIAIKMGVAASGVEITTGDGTPNSYVARISGESGGTNLIIKVTKPGSDLWRQQTENNEIGRASCREGVESSDAGVR